MFAHSLKIALPRAVLSITIILASPLCSAIDLVSTNSAGLQGPVTEEPRASAISNDGNTVLFVADDPTLIPGVAFNLYLKTMSTGAILPILKRFDGLPLQTGIPNYSHMNEPPT